MLHVIQVVWHFFFPSGVLGDDEESFLNDKKEPDIEKLKQVLDLCPTVDELQELAKDGDFMLKQKNGGNSSFASWAFKLDYYIKQSTFATTVQK